MAWRRAGDHEFLLQYGRRALPDPWPRRLAPDPHARWRSLLSPPAETHAQPRPPHSAVASRRCSPVHPADLPPLAGEPLPHAALARHAGLQAVTPPRRLSSQDPERTIPICHAGARILPHLLPPP